VLVPNLVSRSMVDSRTPPPPQLSGLSSLPHAETARSGSVVIWKPALQQPSAESSSNYSVEGRNIGMYVGYYRQQNYRRKLVSSENELVKSLDPVWVQLGTSSEAVEIGGDTITFRTALIRRAPAPAMPEQRLRVWHIYWVGDRLTSSAFWAKVYGALDQLVHHRDDAAVIVLYTSENEPSGARGVLDSFARANLRPVVDQLRATRDGVVASGEASGLRNRW